MYISYLEIYNENAFDLLDKDHEDTDLDNWKKIGIYEDLDGNIVLKNLITVEVSDEREAMEALMNGNYIRHVTSTPMNQASSRSHGIFTITLEISESESEVVKLAKINLVDLAGSERLKASAGNFDVNLANETKYINLSLSFLEQVIIALNERAKGIRAHIPYRNSLMTTILRDSLGGNCKTVSF